MFRKNLINTFHARLLDDDFPDTRAGHLAKSMDYLHSSLCFLDMTVLAKLNKAFPDMVNICLEFEKDATMKPLTERIEQIKAGK
jgi:hypothetical protein|tara:strand:+ start:714 stop:965 length:252 start_codon:yes stop_codon:yes gene_type:complete